MGLLNPTNTDDITKAVENHEERFGYLDEILYKRCIKDIKGIEDIKEFDLCKINEKEGQQIINVIRVFLIYWGGLRRVLNKKEKKIGRKGYWR